MIQVLNKRILLKPHKIDTSGIISPDDIEHYEVYAIGKEVKGLKKGDNVLYENGRKLKINNVEYISTDEENIVCIL